MVTLSIVIPAHNVAPYILECLESIRNQSYGDYEVLIIENCSTDNTFVKSKEFSEKDSRFKVFQSEIKGVSNARNLGLKHSHGKYVSFIDGDDFISVDYYHSLINAIEADNDIDIAISPFYVYNGPGSIVHTVLDCKYGIINDIEDRKKLFKEGSICHRIFRKSFLDKYNLFFDDSLKMGEDILFAITSLVLSYKIAIIDKGGYFYRVSVEGSASTKVYKFAMVKNMLECYEKFENISKQYNVYDEYKSLLDIEIVHVILGRSLGMSRLRCLCRKDVRCLIERRKDFLLEMTLDKNLSSRGFRFELWFYKVLLRINTYGHYFKFIRIFRNICLQPLHIKLR